ncbi:enoyl-CoA hydratase/isomerase family protein [Maritimibacter sp. HL-12]|uniref:enoyl-CoA hydratase/isomerase family protein n=1 Tax=Maritimibacter sp. HL-12 TaxID=1162418 RepID=UPI000A0EFB08|nr:enoyl-CoA hydratase-related protein [Maritimibacter sp. HL-12]SMH28840.1 2-(1,2-epoxy-1,2-dihydrophenyl)acetyl-CoA isomerase [Maritimibacter sp. HL-12]
MGQDTVIEKAGLLLDSPSPGVAEVRLNRPEKLNALDEATYRALTEVFQQLHEDPAVRAVILCGAGRGFCSGSDIGAMLKTTGPAARARLQRRHATVQAIYRIEKPVVAAVHGPAAGIGFSLAMASDLILAAENAYFQQAFTNVGLVPDGGSVFFMGQRLGVARAKDLVMTGRRLGAQEALDWGVINRVLPEAQLMDEARALAAELAAAPTFVLGLAKKMFAATCAPSLETVLEIESYAADVARASNDHREGVMAFREKRKPLFTGE